MKMVVKVVLDILGYIGTGVMYMVIGSVWALGAFVIPALVIVALWKEGATASHICLWVYVCGYAFSSGVAFWWASRKIRYGKRSEVEENLWGFPVLCAGWPIVIGISLTCAFALGVVHTFAKLYDWSHSK